MQEGSVAPVGFVFEVFPAACGGAVFIGDAGLRRGRLRDRDGVCTRFSIVDPRVQLDDRNRRGGIGSRTFGAGLRGEVDCAPVGRERRPERAQFAELGFARADQARTALTTADPDERRRRFALADVLVQRGTGEFVLTERPERIVAEDDMGDVEGRRPVTSGRCDGSVALQGRRHQSRQPKR
jgi:hypothetical protein